MSIAREKYIYPIADDSDPLLRQISLPVEINDIKSIKTKGLVEDMFATMYAASGIGLAAPQIRILKRIMVFYLPATRDDINGVGIPETVLINPEMTVLDDSQLIDFEGCLSVPGKRGRVKRYRKIKYSGYDVDGNLVEREAEGWHARLFQHEFDHLNGVLYPDLMAAEDKLISFEDYKVLMAAKTSDNATQGVNTSSQSNGTDK